MAEELTAKDVIKAHARDELGIDVDDMTNPWQAAIASAIAFTIGAGMPLLAGAFIQSYVHRLLSIVIVTSFGLLVFGVGGALLGGASTIIGGARVLIGGWIAMGATYGIGRAFAGHETSYR